MNDNYRKLFKTLNVNQKINIKSNEFFRLKSYFVSIGLPDLIFSSREFYSFHFSSENFNHLNTRNMSYRYRKQFNLLNVNEKINVKSNEYSSIHQKINVRSWYSVYRLFGFRSIRPFIVYSFEYQFSPTNKRKKLYGIN